MRRHWLVLVMTLSSVVLACERKPDPSLSRMLEQRRGDPFAPSDVFPDGKVMRDPPRGAVAVDDETDDAPPPIDRALVELGHARYDVFCGQCHGLAGDGHSFVAEKMTLRKPPSIADSRSAIDHDFTIVTNGYGLMPGLAGSLSAKERWATVAYVQALQLRRVRVSELPK